MIPRRVTLFASALIVSLNAMSSGAARGDSIKFCFDINGVFVDNDYALPGGTTEDFWVTDLPKALRGARTIIKIGMTTYFDGNLGDGIGAGDPGLGCTTTMTVPAANSTYQFQHYSSGGLIDNLVGGQHFLNAQLDDDDGTVHDVNLLTVWVHTGGEGTFSIELLGTEDATNLWRLHATAAVVLARVGRWADASVLDIFVDNDEDARNHYDNGNVFINAANQDKVIGIQRKFAIAHEIGHFLADVHANATGGNCDLSDSQCPSNGSHGMSSKEYQGCAFTEGFAHFFSASAWNNFGADTDCVFRYWADSTIDCEGSLTSNWPEAYMETLCYNTSHTGRGVELDWLRQFWDVQTDGTQPNFDDMMEWVQSSWFFAVPPDWEDPYFQLDNVADLLDGAIDSNWDAAKGTNGIDW